MPKDHSEHVLFPALRAACQCARTDRADQASACVHQSDRDPASEPRSTHE
jgi:hypothetical protein